MSFFCFFSIRGWLDCEKWTFMTSVRKQSWRLRGWTNYYILMKHYKFSIHELYLIRPQYALRNKYGQFFTVRFNSFKRAICISEHPTGPYVCGRMWSWCLTQWVWGLRAQGTAGCPRPEVRLHLNHVHSQEEGLFLSSVSLCGGRSGPWSPDPSALSNIVT